MISAFHDRSIFQSRTGDLTAQVDGRLIYSRYDPLRDVERFVERLEKSGDLRHPGIVIVVSEGLGHLERTLSFKYPESTLLSLHLDSECSRHSGIDPDSICPSARVADLRTFLQRRTGLSALRNLTVVEWPPAREVYRAEYHAARSRLREAIRQIAGDEATVHRWGRRWIHNVVRNCERISDSYALPQYGNRPVLTVCAGPSACATIEHLSSREHRPVIVAVSSALPLLFHHGIRPEIAVHTDAGFYSSLHTAEALRCDFRRTDANMHWVLPLTAHPLSRVASGGNEALRETPLTVISGGSFIESVIATAARLETPRIPEAGTVSATALRVASMISTGDQFVCGLDLALRDTETHARPHAFDSYIFCESNRFRNELTHRVDRTNATTPLSPPWRSAPNLETYAGWFRDHAPEFAHVRRIDPSPVEVGISEATVEDMTRATMHLPPIGTQNRAGSGARLQTAVGDWRLTRFNIVPVLLRQAARHDELRDELSKWLQCAPDLSAIEQQLVASLEAGRAPE